PLAAGSRLFQRHLPNDCIPPTNFVVAVITNDSRIAAEWSGCFFGKLIDPADNFFIPHVEPRRATASTESQHGRHPKIVLARLADRFEIAPTPQRGKAP